MSEARAAWGLHLWAGVCPACDWRYLIPEAQATLRCPHCHRAEVLALAETALPGMEASPELVVDPAVSGEAVAKRLAEFAATIPFPPEDLTPQALRQRMVTLYLPQWLVDAEVRATWEAETGFDYDVVSHQERYSDGAGWRTRQVEERRVRWEPRLGRVQRRYDNVPVPALEEHAALERRLGAYRLQEARAYRPEDAKPIPVRLPDRDPEAAWPEAERALWTLVEEDCRKAAGADHIRRFRWGASFSGQHWTLLLLPVLTSYYTDDEGAPCPVLFNGQTGRISGVRRASQRRAGQRALLLAGIAAALLVVAVIAGLASALIPPLILLAGLLGLAGAGLGVGSLAPVVRAWRFNRRERAGSGP